jgi:8-oxo-dGTP pyrophosphatase MutT (NUDIX family)
VLCEPCGEPRFATRRGAGEQQQLRNHSVQTVTLYAMSIEKVRTVFTGRVIVVNVETVRLPNGLSSIWRLSIIPAAPRSAALDHDRRVCLIRQYRHAADGWIWELPAGKLEPHEPPLQTARRELAEETGTSAHKWSALGPYVSSPGVFTETVHLFLAQDLESGKMAQEAAELIEVHWIDLEEACARALNGTISDGKTALGLLRARAALASRALSSLVAPSFARRAIAIVSKHNPNRPDAEPADRKPICRWKIRSRKRCAA